MAEFKVVVGDPETGRAHPVTVDGQHANVLVRKRIGEEVDGMFLGLPGYTVQITGGTDKDGFPMRPEIPMAGRTRILVSKSVGFRPKDKGVREKRTYRGNEISPDITQINCKIIDRGPKPVEQLLGAEEDVEDAPEAEAEEEPSEEEAPEEESSEEDAADEEAADEGEDEDEAAE